jgi:hypothetical protein
LGLASDGVHSNGYSLVRRIVARTGLGWDAPRRFRTTTLGAALLTPTRLYVRSVAGAVRAGGVHALAHITGGGLTENLPRVSCPRGWARDRPWRVGLPPVFRWLAERAGWRRRCSRPSTPGSGWFWWWAQAMRADRLRKLREAGETVHRIGTVAPGGACGTYRHACVTVRVGILISGGGSNMVTLARSMTGAHPARPCVVVSNNPDAGGLERARELGLPAVAVDHRPFGKDRAGFEAALAEALAPHRPISCALRGSCAS